MLILLAAGGTGGHIYPAIAVAQALSQNPNVRVQFVGVGREIEEKLVRGAGFEYQILPFVPLLGGGLPGLIKLCFALPIGVFRAWRLFTKLKPASVGGFGGYPSFLPMFVAYLRGVSSVLQEQNVKVGVANKLLSLFACKIYAVPGAEGFWRSDYVSELLNPVRDVISKVKPWRKPKAGEKLRLLIIGGSQGAVSLNSAIIEILPQLGNFEIVHQAGKNDIKRLREAYAEHPNARVESFIDDMASEYERAQIIISRAGAMSVAEIATAGRPAIFVPLPIAGAHQEQNARPLEAAGAARIIRQDENLAEMLSASLAELSSHPDKLAEMVNQLKSFSPEEPAAEVIATELLKLASRRLKK